MIDKIKALIRRKSSCVLATTDGKIPHCSLMAYVTSEAADRLYLVTPSNTKKYRNIKDHPDVSLLIDTRGEQVRDNTQALTVAGTCHFLDADEEIDSVKDAFDRQHPHLRDFIRKRGVAFVCVEFDSFLFVEGPERVHHEIIRTNRD
jgi:nitroimidazol reductase NimA-like FMN-containing flavoprotein (pyridoxamine 5'-phosphate oxidase superfamily)